MPRPKVHDSQRQRAAEACSFCRESKKKCSGKAPCTQCQRRGLEQECTITYLPRGYRSRHDHGAARAGRQSWGSIPQVANDTTNDNFLAGLQSPSNAMGSQTNDNAVEPGQNEPFRPLSPCESREENDDNRYGGPGSAATVRGNGNSAAKDSSQAELAPRMLLSSHGERGSWSRGLWGRVVADLGLRCSLYWSHCLDCVSANCKASCSRPNWTFGLLT